MILPQKEKKSDTVFSVALGEILDTNTALVSYTNALRQYKPKQRN